MSSYAENPSPLKNKRGLIRLLVAVMSSGKLSTSDIKPDKTSFAF